MHTHTYTTKTGRVKLKKCTLKLALCCFLRKRGNCLDTALSTEKGECKFGDKCHYVHDSRIQIPCLFCDCKFVGILTTQTLKNNRITQKPT